MDTIPALNQTAIEAAKAHQDTLLKPLGALGRLEELHLRLAGITGQLFPDITRKCVVVMAADNGVWEEGISPVPQSVTTLMADSMLRGLAGVNVLARQAGAEVFVVDVGIKEPLTRPGFIDRNILRGTGNIAKGPAMTRKQAQAALEVGLDMARHCKQQGMGVVGVGEMGICNTTTAAAVLACLTQSAPGQTAGMGVGLTQELYDRKKDCIAKALEINRPNPEDALDIMAKVGGLDIAAMCGLFLGCARLGLPVVADGFISTVAALCACRMDPGVKDYLFASHASQEPGYAIAAREIGFTPYFQMDMRLGEGSGCPLLFRLLDDALAIAREMGTFAQGNVEGGDLVDIREDNP